MLWILFDKIGNWYKERDPAIDLWHLSPEILLQFHLSFPYFEFKIRLQVGHGKFEMIRRQGFHSN